MLTNGPKPVASPFVRGKWNGYFIYGPECCPELSGVQCCFSASLSDHEDGLFSGTGTDPDQRTDQFVTLIEGHINEERILFSMENRDQCFYAIFKGTWNAGTQQFSGAWRTAGYPDQNQEHRGDWIMEFDEPFSLDYAEEENFPQLSGTGDLNYAYSEDDDRDNRSRTLVSLSVIFILLATGLGTFVSTNGNIFVTVSFIGLAFGSIMSLILLINAIKKR